MWGLPDPSTYAPSGDIVYGGCVLDSEPSARWQCDECGSRYFLARTDEPVAQTTHESERPEPRTRPRPRVRRQGWHPGAPEGPIGRTFRLASEGGGAFTLTPVVDTDPLGALVVTYDVGLVTPDREVRYLRRPLSRSLLDALEQAFWGAASDLLPEQSVGNVSDRTGGLGVAILQSTPDEVTLELSVVEEVDADVLEYDVVVLDVSRADLVAASHAMSDLKHQAAE